MYIVKTSGWGPVGTENRGTLRYRQKTVFFRVNLSTIVTISPFLTTNQAEEPVRYIWLFDFYINGQYSPCGKAMHILG